MIKKTESGHAPVQERPAESRPAENNAPKREYQTSNNSEREDFNLANKTMEVNTFDWESEERKGKTMNISEFYMKTGDQKKHYNQVMDQATGKLKKTKYLSLPMDCADDEWNLFIYTIDMMRYEALGRMEEAKEVKKVIDGIGSEIEH